MGESDIGMYAGMGAALLVGVLIIGIITVCFCLNYCRNRHRPTKTEALAQQVDEMQPGDAPPPWPVISRQPNGPKGRTVYIETHPGRAYLPERVPAPAPSTDPATASYVEQQDP